METGHDHQHVPYPCAACRVILERHLDDVDERVSALARKFESLSKAFYELDKAVAVQGTKLAAFALVGAMIGSAGVQALFRWILTGN